MTNDHPRNTAAMLTSPRCGAKTRNGGACRSPAVQGKKRCRMHGGAAGSGAPKGNKNALTHGRFTKEAIKRRKEEREEQTFAEKYMKRQYAILKRRRAMKFPGGPRSG
jgi:uncharacterized protein YjcR